MGRSAELAVSVPLRGLPPRGRSGTVCSAHSCKLFPTSRHLLPQPCSRTSLRNWGPGVMGETLARNDTYLAHTRWARACAARSRSVRVYSPHAPCLVCFATARRKPPPPGTCCASARAVRAPSWQATSVCGHGAQSVCPLCYYRPRLCGGVCYARSTSSR